MALGAHLSGCLVIEHLPELGSMGAVTASATNREVLVAWVPCLLPDGVSRMLAPVVASGAQIKISGFFGQEHKVRRVGIVAFSTAPFNHRLMFGDILLHPLHGVGVATAAQLGHWLSEQALVCRRM